MGSNGLEQHALAPLGGLEHRSEEERNSVWLLFTDSAIHNLLLDWNAEARQILGQFRANTANYPRRPERHNADRRPPEDE